MDERQARETIVRAGIELLKSGLLVRTWGNISCRLDDARFAITPSGRAYETLKPEDIVICSIANANAVPGAGNINPSSERGVHALIYRQCRDAGFVIHTHQRFASAMASSMVTAVQNGKMGAIPVAAYGLSGTKKLIRNVEAALAKENGAILMAHHGALCYGKEYGETFSAALALEEACERFMYDSYMKASGAKNFDKSEMLDYYVRKVTTNSAERRSGAVSPVQVPVFSIRRSKRSGAGIIASSADGDTAYGDTSCPSSASSMPEEARIHFAIYLSRPEINYIELADQENVVAASLAGKPLPQLLDDFAQMMGRPMRIAPLISGNRPGIAPGAIVKALGKAGGVLIPGAGALCCAATENDAHALCLVTEKNALAEICAAMLGKSKPLSPFDCYLMHLVYSRKYAKLY